MAEFGFTELTADPDLSGLSLNLEASRLFAPSVPSLCSFLLPLDCTLDSGICCWLGLAGADTGLVP